MAHYALSKELNRAELQTLTGGNAFVFSSGNIKLMDLCYCPFGKTCKNCDKKSKYILTDENGREFPVRRYESADGLCRFEVYNCANLVAEAIDGVGILTDLSVVDDKTLLLQSLTDTDKQKQIFKNYTSGHRKKGIL